MQSYDCEWYCAHKHQQFLYTLRKNKPNVMFKIKSWILYHLTSVNLQFHHYLWLIGAYDCLYWTILVRMTNFSSSVGRTFIFRICIIKYWVIIQTYWFKIVEGIFEPFQKTLLHDIEPPLKWEAPNIYVYCKVPNFKPQVLYSSRVESQLLKFEIKYQLVVYPFWLIRVIAHSIIRPKPLNAY